ncbi:MAG: S-layer homology domain-containing protein [Moorellales bacterium]
MLKLFSRDRYLAGNLCLVLFVAFLLSLALTAVPTGAQASAQGFQDFKVKTSTGVELGGTATEVDATEPELHIEFRAVAPQDFQTLLEKLYLKVFAADNTQVGQTVYFVYREIYASVKTNVYGNVYGFVYSLPVAYLPVGTQVYRLTFFENGAPVKSVYIKPKTPPPEGGGPSGATGPTTPPTTPTSFGTVAWDAKAGTGTVEVNANQFADQVRQAQQAGQAAVDLRVTPPAEVALKTLTLEAPAQAVLAAATAGVGMAIGTPDLYVTFDPAKLPPNLKAQFEAKPNAVLSFTFNVLSAEEARQAAAVPADYRLAGSVAVVQLAFDGQALPGSLTLSYGGPVTSGRTGLFAALDLTGLFRGQKLAALTVDEDKLGLYRYNEATRSWEYLGGRVDKATKTVTAKVAALTQAKYAVMAYEKTFTDLLGHWARRDVEIMAARHIAGGVSETLFAPNGKVTRAQFAALLIRTLGITEAKPAASSFTDVAASDWYFGAVETARAAGLVGGYPDGTFRPEAPITREEMAAMVCRALGYAGKKPVLAQPVEVLLARFSDTAQIGTWAREAVAAAVSENILRGRDGQAAPKANATRAEATVMLKRALVSLGEISSE